MRIAAREGYANRESFPKRNFTSKSKLPNNDLDCRYLSFSSKICLIKTLFTEQILRKIYNPWPLKSRMKTIVPSLDHL